MKKNTYSKALKILKSTELDNKIKSLNEMPTNHTTGLYSLNDPGYRVGDPDPEEYFVPDIDGDWPNGVPGTPGEYRYIRPKGYWSGGKNWESVNTPDLSQGYLEKDPTGRNTDGLISSDGVVKTFLPPDSRNFILGPVVDGFVPNHGYDAYTNIGYIQKDTRQFVLLARIQGQFKANLNGNYSVWDGTSNGLTIYNQNFTLAMAQWVRDQVNSDKFVTKVPYFYSGGVPQVPQSPADCPNCPPGMYGGNGYGGGDGSGPFGWGQGGDPGNITIGNQQVPPKSGDAKDAGFPWEIFKNIANKVTDAAKNAWNFATKAADAISSMFGDPKAAIESGLYNLGQSFAQQVSGSGADFNSYARTIQDTINSFVNTYNPPPYNPDPRAVANMMTPQENAAFKAGGGVAALTKGNQSIQDVISQGYKNLGQYDSSIGRTPTSSTSNAELQKLMSKAPGTHTPAERQKLLDAGLDDFVRGGKTSSPLGDLAILGATAALVKGAAVAGLSGLAKLGLAVSGTAIANQAKETFVDKANSADQYNKQLAGKLVSSIISGQTQKIELSDNAKKDQIKNVNILEFEKALQIGSTPKPSADSTVNPTQKRPVLTGGWGTQGGSEVHYDPKTDTLTITSEKMLRTTSGGNTVERDSSGRITRFSDIPEPTDSQVSDITKKLMTGPLDPLMQGISGVAQVLSPSGGATTWEKIKSDPFLLQVFSDNLGKATNDLAKGAVQGTASNTVALRKVLTNLGMPQSEIEKTGGGYGQVYSQTSYKGNEIPPELRTVIDKKTNFKETFYLKKVKSIIKEQEAVQPTTSPSVPPPSPTPEQPSARMGTGETPTPQSKAQLNFLLKQDSPGFISGYLGGMDVDDLKNSLVGTNLSWQTTNNIIEDIKNYDSLGRFYTQEWSRLTSYYTPIRNDLISKMQSAINAKDMGSFYRNLSEIDKTFSITDSYMKAADQATKSWVETVYRLYGYVKGGKLNPQSQFQLDDPTVTRSQQEKRKRDEEIVKEIQKLNQEASDNEKAAQLNKLKALGMGALVAGILVLGAAVLAESAIVASLGAATIRSLKSLLGLSDDAIKGLRGSVDDIGQAGLGNVTGQVADDAANVVDKLLKSSGGEAGGQGRTLANQIQRASDDGNVELVKKLIKSAEKYLYNSYEPKGKVLSESRRRILREIKKPVVVPEIPKQKYKMNFSGKYSPQNTPDKTSSELSDALVASGNARGQKWKIDDKYWQGYETTERMNVIYDRVGHGDQYWERIIDENKNKKSWRDQDVQEKLNIIAHEKAMIQENPSYKSPFLEPIEEQETIEADNDPLFKKVAKRLKKEIDYVDKPSKNGNPNTPPPEMVNGYHPNFGKRVDYYKKLDPQSASAMPPTGDPEIDDQVEKAKLKKIRIKEHEKNNWKKDIYEDKKKYVRGEVINEKMTSYGTFFTTLPATGDVDLQITNLNSNEYLDPAGNVSFDPGTNSGFTGGFSSGGEIINFDGESDFGTGVLSNPNDFSSVDTVNITAIAGNNSNGGMLPTSPLILFFTLGNEISDPIQVIPTSSSSFTNVNISIPETFRKPGVEMFFYSNTSDGFGYHGRHFRSQTIPIPGLNHTAISGLFPQSADSGSSIANLISFYLRDNKNTQQDFYSLGYFLWFNSMSQRFGWFDNVGTQEDPELIYRTWPAAPVSGATTFDNVTAADYRYVGQTVYNLFKGTKLYGISNVSFRRRSPMNVFVSLDSPEASSFIRTDPNLSNLSPQERLQKLKEMLEASDEYVMKILGSDFPGTGAVPPGEYDPFKQAPPGEAGDTPGVEIAQLSPKTEKAIDDMLMRGLKNGDYGDPNSPYIQQQIRNLERNLRQGTPGGLPQASAGQDTQIAADFTNQGGQRVLGPHTNIKYDPVMKMYVPVMPKPGVPIIQAHYEPQGQVILEKRKLKSPQEILNKIPGYYDGKPAPLGFPVEPPPKMVNGMHPDLVDGKKVSDRFNRLDPESAKAMPPTGNPHIDKKVRAARKKPK